MKIFKQAGQITGLLLLVTSILFLSSYGYSEEINNTFKAKDMVDITTVSGDCIIKKGSNDEIRVQVVYSFPVDKYKPVLIEEGDTLILKEKFNKTDNGDFDIDGSSTWTIYVPAKTKIDFSSASGSLEIGSVANSITAKMASGDVNMTECSGKIELKTASGDINVINSTGDLVIKSASGDININQIKGVLNFKTASGDIKAKGVELTGASEFHTASGDVNLTLAKTAAYDIDMAVVSGDISLDYNGHPVKGSFTFKGMKDNINSDVAFDDKEESGHSPFISRSFQKDGATPKISLKAVSGSISFKK